MKILENSNETELTKIKKEWLDENENEANYFCLCCGSINSVRAFCVETRYVDASVVNMAGDLEDYDDCGNSDFEVTYYKCMECEGEDRALSHLITYDIEAGWKAYRLHNDIPD